MGKFEALFEDEDNIFGGTPKSKFWDIANTANDEIVKDEVDKIIGRYSIMETLLEEKFGVQDLEKVLEQYAFEHFSKVEMHKKSLYIAFTGDIVCRLDS